MAINTSSCHKNRHVPSTQRKMFLFNVNNLDILKWNCSLYISVDKYICVLNFPICLLLIKWLCEKYGRSWQIKGTFNRDRESNFIKALLCEQRPIKSAHVNATQYCTLNIFSIRCLLSKLKQPLKIWQKEDIRQLIFTSLQLKKKAKYNQNYKNIIQSAFIFNQLLHKCIDVFHLTDNNFGFIDIFIIHPHNDLRKVICNVFRGQICILTQDH